MKIEILKVRKYRRCPVYVRHFGHIFEYLVIFKGKLYSHYFDIKPVWYRRKYTPQQMQNCLRVVISAAEALIDKLKKDGSKISQSKSPK